MAREIKFRAKVKHHDPMRNPENGWVEGYYFQDLTQGEMRSYIFNCPCYWEVIPETVGQLTGQLDKNKKEIWEGDIVRVGILSPNYIGSHPEPYYVDTVCIYKEGAFLYKRISPFDKKKLSRNWTYKPMHRYDIYSTGVIGNIHDNPELLEGGAE